MHWTHLPARQLLENPSLQRQWDQLNAARQDLPFLSADAMAAALEVLGNGKERLLLATGGQGEARAMLVMVPDGRLRWTTFQPSQLPLGAWVAKAGISPCALSRSLLRGPLGFALVVSITQVDPLLAPREADAADARHADYIPTAWLEVDGSFEDYWAQRGKNLRQNLRKQRNRLAAEGVTTTLRQLRAPQDMAAALGRYGALETAGWKADRGTAIHPDNEQGRFYRLLLETAAGRGEALVTEYLFGEHTVAMNLGLMRGGTWVVLKTAYDETVSKALSPASLLREEELQFIFNQREIRRIEYYGRVMEWHTKLTDRQRTLYHLTTYRWPWLKALTARGTQAPVQTTDSEAAGASSVQT